uniref:Putative leucine-rich repeat protein n=2 Tax=Culex tarsalis TaxID=7177 RepID=A0A1Q3FRW8_CULTA
MIWEAKMQNLILLAMLAFAGTTKAIKCQTFSATNWTWSDDLIEKWLIYPKTIPYECSNSSTLLRNLPQDVFNDTGYINAYFTSNIWIDESYLREIDLQYFGIRTIRISNSVFTKLSISNFLNAIHFQNVPIKVIPSLKRFEGLRIWSGKNISIKSLDLSSFNKRHLESLQITNGYLSWFQVGSSFNSLKELDLHENKLQTLPNDLYNLVAVGKLNFSKNRLEFLEMDLFDRLEHLKVLDLSYNRLSVSTYSPMQLPALERLVMNNCDLKSLNVLYWQMPNLERLNLENNSMLSYVNHLRNHFSEDTIIQITTVENWCCDWLEEVKLHFKVEQRTSGNENILGRHCSENPFYEPFPMLNDVTQFKIDQKRHLQQIFDKLKIEMIEQLNNKRC